MRRAWRALTTGPRLRSWKLLVCATGLYALGAIALAVAVAVVAVFGPERGEALGLVAVVLAALAAVAVVAFGASVGLAYLLYRDVAKPAVSLFVIAAGTAAYAASGWFGGFLPLFLAAAASGALGLYESLGGGERPG